MSTEVSLEDLAKAFAKVLPEAPGRAPTVAELLRHVESCPECGKVFGDLVAKRVKEKGFLSKEDAERWLEEKKKEWIEKAKREQEKPWSLRGE
jgi:hypothetical protein